MISLHRKLCGVIAYTVIRYIWDVWNIISVAPDPVMNLKILFVFNDTSPTNNVTRITWTPPEPTNGSFYQILKYSYSSAYTVGPMYGDSNTTELDQNENEFADLPAFYYTVYNITVTTVNGKYDIDNGDIQRSNQSLPAGIYEFLL